MPNLYKFYAFSLFIVLFFVPLLGFAKIGVGVTTGKIQVNEPLKQGSLNQINPVTVVNTGDEPSKYRISTGYLMNQTELRPPEEWFVFSPRTFSLEPGKTQKVDVTLNIPVNDIKPGDYLVYLEAEPIQNSEDGEGTSIGIAAATKLYFSIAPANIFQGFYYRTKSILENYSPWSYVAVGVPVILILIVSFRRYFNININIQKKE